MYEYMSVELAEVDRIAEINNWANQGWRLIQIIKEGVWGNPTPIYYGVFERVKT